MAVNVGDTLIWERTFSEDDVRLFAETSGDQGAHHVERDARGRLMVHGLLTATLPTKIGGDLNYVAREMVFEFLRPVFTGDRIRCEVTLTSVEPDAGRTNVAASFRCVNQEGKEVMTGRTRGVVLEHLSRSSPTEIVFPSPKT